EGVQVFSTRGAAGWSSVDVGTPNEVSSGAIGGFGQEYRFFSSDLSRGVVQRTGPFLPSLSAEASERTPYLRSLFADGDVEDACVSSCFAPLATGVPGFENVPPGTEIGREGGPAFIAASSDLAHVVVESPVALTEEAPGGGPGLYEWSAGRFQLINVLPGGLVAPQSSAPILGDSPGNIAASAISADGSRVIWSEHAGGSHLYMRDMRERVTVRLDAIQAGASGEGSVGPLFQFASSDGSRIFFTDTQGLTVDAGSGGGNADLYECVIVDGGGEPECDLSDLTPHAGAESAHVQGVIGGSEEGSSLYFVADGVLSTNTDSSGQQAVQGTCGIFGSHPATPMCNLYLERDGTTSLVAVISSEDNKDWAGSNGGEGLGARTARVSRDGEWLAFMSQRSLTGYDNRDAVSGVSDEEVYLYHAGDGKVVCASCNPSGARPRGVEYERLRLVAGDRVWKGKTWLAANVPGWTSYTDGLALYQSRYLSDSGRLFFDSSDALVSQDTNGTEDVYEYEPVSVGLCANGVSTFGEASGGCVDLISSGTSKEESAFLDASESGDDVFFLTASQLSGRDTDDSLDVYDAHVGGGEREVLPAVECQGDACQHPVAAPEDPTPGSLTYQGPGNITIGPAVVRHGRAVLLSRAQKLANALKACRHRPKRKRAVCKRQARRAYVQARKASSTGKGRGR
ncbi:MAG: hypothetical protein WAN93_09565, partial [Solirubrobacteraceae bacterium]